MTVPIQLDAGQGGIPQLRIYVPVPMNGDAPPTEICLFRAGDNATTKGVFRFTDRSAALVRAEYELRGIKRSGDYEHTSLLPAKDMLNPVEQGKASCQYELELRPAIAPLEGASSDLYAARINWTPEADRQLRARERIYYSPAFDTDVKTGEVARFANFAITNDPATHNLTPLVAVKAEAPAHTLRTETSTMKKLAAHVAKRCTEMKLSNEELASKLSMEPDEMAKMLSADAEGWKKPWQDKLRTLGRTLKTPMADLRAMRDDEEKDEEQEELRVKALKDAEEIEKLKKQLGNGGLFGGKLSASRDGLVRLTGKTDDVEIVEAAVPLVDLGSKIMTLSGAKTPGEAYATIFGKVGASEQVVSLNARLELAEKQLRDAATASVTVARNVEFDGVIAEAKKARKLSPAMLAEGSDTAAYLTLLRDDATNGVKQLKAYVKALPSLVGPDVVEANDAQLVTAQVKLTDEEKAVAKMTGTDPAAVETHKRVTLTGRATA